MELFDSTKEDFHQCPMDNIYNSATFCKTAYNHPRKVMCHRVTRQRMRGIPPSVQQKEVMNRKEQKSVGGRVHAAVLESPFMYDAKSVDYLSMMSNELT